MGASASAPTGATGADPKAPSVGSSIDSEARRLDRQIWPEQNAERNQI